MVCVKIIPSYNETNYNFVYWVVVIANKFNDFYSQIAKLSARDMKFIALRLQAVNESILNLPTILGHIRG